MAGTFAEWTDRLKVYNEFITALAEHRLKTAQAEKALAEAANELATVRAKNLVIRELDRDFTAYRRTNAFINRERNLMTKRARQAALLLGGRKLPGPPFTRAYREYEWFETRALIESPDSLFDVAVPSNARKAANFIDRTTGQPAEKTAPDDITNGLQLFDWMQANEAIAKTGSEAQRVVTKLFSAISTVAAAETKRMQEFIEQMRKNIFDTWQPVSILGVPVNAAAKKVESAGVKQ